MKPIIRLSIEIEGETIPLTLGEHGLNCLCGQEDNYLYCSSSPSNLLFVGPKEMQEYNCKRIFAEKIFEKYFQNGFDQFVKNQREHEKDWEAYKIKHKQNYLIIE